MPLCGHCYLSGVCERRSAIVPSVETVGDPMVRLGYQNHLVGLNIQPSAMVDHHVNAIRDFLGGYRDEKGMEVLAPSYLPVLNPGAQWWFADQVDGGKWTCVEDVLNLREEAVGKWRLVGTVMCIKETNFPLCHRG